MPLPRRPRDCNQLAKLVVDVATGEVPNDKEQVLAALSEQKQPTGRTKSAKARAASQTAVRRTEVGRNLRRRAMARSFAPDIAWTLPH